MKNRPSVSSLNKEFGNVFFLSRLCNQSCACITEEDAKPWIIDALRDRGYVCVYVQEYYYIFKKEN